MKKGRADEALRSFHAVYRYTDDNLKFIAYVGEAYEKARNDPNLAQNQKEALYPDCTFSQGLPPVIRD